MNRQQRRDTVFTGWGGGETRFPHLPARGPGPPQPLHRVGAWGNRVSPRLSPRDHGHVSRPCGCAAHERDEHKIVPGRAVPSQTLPPGEGLGADRTHERRGALWRWDALIGPHPLPLSRARERGNQSRALGRPNAVEAALARMFCPPLTGEGMGKPGFPIPLLEGCTLPTLPRAGAWGNRVSPPPFLRELMFTSGAGRTEGARPEIYPPRVCRHGWLSPPNRVHAAQPILSVVISDRFWHTFDKHKFRVS